MNGIAKDSFLAAKDDKARDAMLYDMIEGLYKRVSFKRTLSIAFLGAVLAIGIVLIGMITSPETAIAMLKLLCM